MDLQAKPDHELDVMIQNYVKKSATALPAFRELLEERGRRAQLSQKLNLEKSLQHLMDAARRGVCVTYGDLAAASCVEWSKARHQMNGSSGHLERLLDLCQARGLPLLTAICVNQSGISNGELGDDALNGFVAGVRGLGLLVTDGRGFHHRCRDECWEWGRRQNAST